VFDGLLDSQVSHSPCEQKSVADVASDLLLVNVSSMVVSLAQNPTWFISLMLIVPNLSLWAQYVSKMSRCSCSISIYDE